MVRLAFSTNAFKKNTLAEAVEAISDIGYAGVEIMADEPHAYPARFNRQQRMTLRQQLARRGKPVSNINAFTHFADGGDTYHPTWIEEDAALRDIRIRHTIHAIELADELGAATISLQPGGPLIGTTQTRTQASERFAAGIEAVLPTARKHNISLAIEPEPGLLIESSDEYAQFKSAYFPRESLVRMNCDVGHLFCVGDDPAEVIRRLHEDVVHVHLEDIGENRVHQHLTPGKGAIDFPSIFKALTESHYHGWVTVELYPYETTAAGVARNALDHLRSLKLV